MNDDLRDVLELVFGFGDRYGYQRHAITLLLDDVDALKKSKDSLALENKKLRERVERMKEANNG